jgi:two-component system chemotaxis sensor kinase CheA
MDEMWPIINEFLTESYENLDQLDQDLVDLEANPKEQTLLASIFRTIHTIKGTCGFLGFTKLESIAHVGENLLSKLRDGELGMTPDIASALLAMVDAIRQILTCIENDRNEGDVDYSKLVETLTRLQSGEVESAAPVTSEEPPTPAEEPGETSEASENDLVVPTTAAVPAEEPPVPETAPEETSALEKEPEPVAQAESVEPAPASGGDTQAAHVARTQESIRVDVELLDTLMNLVGELVLARNQIVQFTSSEKDNTFIATTQHLNQLTTELQEGVMKTRMQPIGNIWSKFPRVVRDLSMSVGKQVKLEMEGKETELDKTLIEAIKDPLTHIVRNSVDHGIESPEARQSNGKNPEGTLKLRAYHEGGQVNIEIVDDGGGIDPDKIRKKAVEKNVVTEQQASRMSDRELINLIFSPGFSTAEKISNISGRGVGMDVVRTNIEKIGGTVDIQSKKGKGTTLKVKIPLTLLKVDQALEEAGVLNIVVLQADNRQFGLVVDGISDTEEIVVKPLGRQLKNITAYAGATIMGDGKVALILDVMGLAQKARVISESGRDRTGGDSADKSRTENGETQTLLIFSLGGDGRMAVPLSMVARLEEFKRDLVESSGDQEVVQYRGEIMPLIHLSEVFGGSRPDGEDMQVIVYSDQNRSVGVVVTEIIDIVEEAVNLKQGSKTHGVLGSTVVQGKVTDLLDVEGVIREADPSFYEQALVAG